MEEKRQFTRIPFDATAQLFRAGETLTTPVIDISLKGILVRQPDAFVAQIGEEWIIDLILDDESSEIKMECRIAHLSVGKVGFQCFHIDLDSVTHLRRLVELNLGDPTLLDRELAALGQ